VPTPKLKPASHKTPADTTKAVNEFMQSLHHPFKCEIEAIRQIILRTHSAVEEGIKWNSPSFRTTEYFATMNLREKDSISVILHLGAKVRDTAITGVPIGDPQKLLKWLSKDRATATFTDAKDIAAKKAALTKIIKQWITYV
jgi:Domain of unknown function (DU1801)